MYAKYIIIYNIITLNTIYILIYYYVLSSCVFIQLPFNNILSKICRKMLYTF